MLLSDPMALQDARRYHPPYNGVIYDVRDSLSWRCHPMTHAVDNPWYFLYYSDEVSIVEYHVPLLTCTTSRLSCAARSANFVGNTKSTSVTMLC